MCVVTTTLHARVIMRSPELGEVGEKDRLFSFQVPEIITEDRVSYCVDDEV